MKKALNIIYYTLTGLLAAFTIVLVIAGIGSYVNQEPLNLFGYGMAPVGSESMEPDIKKGDFVFTNHNFEYSNLLVGDDIIFIGQDANGKQIVVVHRIVEIGSEGQLITKGINNNRVDDEPVYEDNYLGKVIGVNSLLGFGKILIDSRTTIVFILTIMLVVILGFQISDYYAKRQKQKYEKELAQYKEQLLKEYQEKEIKEDK